MAVLPKTIELRIGAFKAACIERGLRLTHQRLIIFRELAATDTHPDAETIWKRVRKHIPSISHDTVYRNLKLLAEYGLISIVGMSNERLRFDANMEYHHHFVCTKCGSIRDFSSRRLDRMPLPEEAADFGAPCSMHFEVKGVCSSCLEKLKKK